MRLTAGTEEADEKETWNTHTHTHTSWLKAAICWM